MTAGIDEQEDYLGELDYFEQFIALLESGKPYSIDKEESGMQEQVTMMKATLQMRCTERNEQAHVKKG